jgi:SAM-dependent methyltransferase
MDNSAQKEYWNSAAGEKWASEADALDAMLAPFNRAVLDAAKLKIGERVLDIGCGAGSLSLLAARETPQLKLIGVDISEPLAKLARDRAALAAAALDVVVADASAWISQDPFDALISRFGVMFFADPKSAFAHMRTQMVQGGRLAFACWRPLPENAWALTPLQIGARFLKTPPQPADPFAPGPFAFAETARLEKILIEAGWQEIKIQPLQTEIVLPGQRAEETAAFMLDVGPLSRHLKDQGIDPAPVGAALADYIRTRTDAGGRTWLGASVSIVTARA